MDVNLNSQQISKFLLQKMAEKMLKNDHTNQALINFGIKELNASGTEEDKKIFFKHYQKYLNVITRRVVLVLSRHPTLFNLKKSHYGMDSFYAPITSCFMYWFSCAEEEREEIAPFLMVIKDNLFDHRNFNKPSVTAFSIYDGKNTIPYRQDGLPLEYLIQEVARDIAKHGGAFKKNDETVLSRLLLAINKRLDLHNDKQKEKQEKVINKVTLNRIMKAYRQCRDTGFKKQRFDFITRGFLLENKKDPITMRNLPSFICKSIVNELQSFLSTAEFSSLSNAQQRLCMSLLIKKNEHKFSYNTLMRGISGGNIKVSLREGPFDEHLKERLHSICQTEGVGEALMAKPLKHINRSKSLSGQDKKSVRKALYEHFNDCINRNLDSDFIKNFSNPITLPYKTFYALRESGVTAKRARKLLDALFSSHSAPGGSWWMHDVCGNAIPQLLRFLSRWSKNPKHTPALNSLVSILTQQIGGAQGNSGVAFNKWRHLNTLAGNENRLTQANPRTLAEWIAIAEADPESERKNQSLIEQSCLTNETGVNLIKIISNMGLTKNFHRQAPKPSVTHKNETPAIKRPIIKTINSKLRVAILPHNDWLGVLGVKVNGVCIGFDSSFHQQHYTPACANLVVFDDRQIYLWGLLIRDQMCSDPRYLLNNLQGALSSEYRKIKKEVVLSLRSTLCQLGDVFTKQHSFNAINLLEPDAPIKILQPAICTPSIRLDLYSEVSKNNKDMLKIYEPLGKITQKKVVIK